MDFRLPFPTLRHLTMVRIGIAALDKEIRPFKKLCEVDKDKRYMMVVLDINLPLSTKTKDDLADVMTGMFHQITDGLFVDRYRSIKNVNNLELLFDVHGKLDISSIWRRHFDREVRNYKDVDPLLDLLQTTIKQEMWYGIDAILSRILSLRFRNPEVVKLMRGKVDCSFQLSQLSTLHMVYRFKYALSEVRSKIISKLFRHCKEISFNKDDGLIIPVEIARIDYDEFMSERVNRNERDSEGIIMTKMIFMIGLLDNDLNLKSFIDVLKDLSQKNQLEFFDFLWKTQLRKPFKLYGDNIFYALLYTFAEWPFIHLFMPFVNILKPFFTIHDYFGFVGDLVKKIPERGRFGAFHANLLVKYWEAIPPDVKKEFRKRGCKKKDCDHKAILKKDMESLAKKNLFLYALISTEMWP